MGKFCAGLFGELESRTCANPQAAEDEVSFSVLARDFDLRILRPVRNERLLHTRGAQSLRELVLLQSLAEPVHALCHGLERTRRPMHSILPDIRASRESELFPTVVDNPAERARVSGRGIRGTQYLGAEVLPAPPDIR